MGLSIVVVSVLVDGLVLGKLCSQDPSIFDELVRVLYEVGVSQLKFAIFLLAILTSFLRDSLRVRLCIARAVASENCRRPRCPPGFFSIDSREVRYSRDAGLTYLRGEVY